MRVVAVGLGQPKHARRFGSKLAPSIDCITNEKPDLYDTYGISRASRMGLVLKPGAVKAGIRATGRGFRQGTSTGDILRLPGTFVVDETGTVRLAHYSDHAGDYPELPDFLRQWAAISADNGR